MRAPLDFSIPMPSLDAGGRTEVRESIKPKGSNLRRRAYTTTRDILSNGRRGVHRLDKVS
jgi:hypothetical protein